MRGVIEVAMLQPSRGQVGLWHLWSVVSSGESQIVTFLAGLSPQKLFGLGHATLDPLGGVLCRNRWHSRRNSSFGFFGEADLGRMRRDIFLQFADDKRTHN